MLVETLPHFTAVAEERNLPVPLAVWTGQGVSYIGAAEPLYFRVPAGLETFTITAQSGGLETVRVNAQNPAGGTETSGQTTPGTDRIELSVPVGDHGGEVWSVATAKADKGVIEDYRLWFDLRLPPVLAPTRDQVFGSRAEE